MWIHNINPVIVDFGALEIRWYGVIFVLGFFISVWWLQWMRKRGAVAMQKDDVWDFAFYMMLGVLIGARLFMIFWRPDIYLLKPWNLLYFWQGGMSYHGGLVGALLVGYWYTKKKNLNFFKLADAVSFPTIFALALGRIANFINGELVGRAWNGAWCVVFPETDQVCRHPSTAYAALKRFLVAGYVCWLGFFRAFSPGFVFWNMVFFEGLGRFIVDFYRLDSLFWGLSTGQWMSLAMVLAALWAFSKWHKKDFALLFGRQD